MGSLAVFLQQEFAKQLPPGWQSQHEIKLLTSDLEQILGYSPRVDLMLQHVKSAHRLWIEFEISRADPVANHAKFAASHLFRPQSETDTFVSMISPHVARGRRNLAANTISVMRQIGMNAFQTVLLPQLSPSNIKRLNHLTLGAIGSESIDVKAEIDRAFIVSSSVISTETTNFHFSANLMEVMLNLYQWNKDMQQPRNQDLWGKRTITYFVFDPRSKNFAPSKFCAYVAISSNKITMPFPQDYANMNIKQYVNIDGQDSRFDGQRARKHLVEQLAMRLVPGDQSPKIRQHFHKWLEIQKDNINVHPSGESFILPPQWF